MEALAVIKVNKMIFLLVAVAAGITSLNAQAKQRVLAKQIVTIEHLGLLSTPGVQMNYLEHITGPAYRVYENIPQEGIESRVYRLDNCELSVLYHKEAIVGFKVPYTPECTFYLQQFSYNGQLPAYNNMRMDSLPYGRFASDCLPNCGNSKDPDVYMTFNLGKADGWITVVLQKHYNSAYDAWFREMRSMISDEMWYSNSLTMAVACDRRITELAYKHYKDAVPDFIWVTAPGFGPTSGSLGCE